MRTINQIQDAIKENEQLEKTLDVDERQCEKERHEARRETRMLLEAIDKPFDRKLEDIRRNKSDTYSKGRELRDELIQAERFVASERARINGTHDAVSFASFLKLMGINTQRITKDTGFYASKSVFELKKTLTNGIEVYRDSDESEYTKYYFVHRLNVVGFYKHRKAEHRGDDTQGYAWANVTKMTDENELSQVMEKKYSIKKNGWNKQKDDYRDGHPFLRETGSSYSYKHIKIDPTSTTIIKYMESLDAKRLNAIDFSNAGNIRIMNEVGY